MVIDCSWIFALKMRGRAIGDPPQHVPGANDYFFERALNASAMAVVALASTAWD